METNLSTSEFDLLFFYYQFHWGILLWGGSFAEMIYNKPHGFQVYSLISYDIQTPLGNHHHHQDDGSVFIILFFLCPFVTLPSCPCLLSPSSHSKHLLLYFLSLWISLHFSITLNKWNHVVFWGGGGGLGSFTQQTCVLSHFSHVQLCVTLWTVAHQAALSMGFSRQEYWSGLTHPPPGNLPDPEKQLAFFYVSCIGRWVLYH